MKEFDNAVKFHGHRCPAMPIGFRTGKMAMRLLGVKRCQNKELIVKSLLKNSHNCLL